MLPASTDLEGPTFFMTQVAHHSSNSLQPVSLALHFATLRVAMAALPSVCCHGRLVCRHANFDYCFHELNRLYYALNLSIRVMPATGWGPSNDNPLKD